jgi:hypothetical protein
MANSPTLTSPQIAGTAQFTGTARPTSAAVGSPAATDLITRADADLRHALAMETGAYQWWLQTNQYQASHVGSPAGSADNNSQTMGLTTGAASGSIAFLRSNQFGVQRWNRLTGGGYGVVNWSLPTVLQVRVSITSAATLTGVDRSFRALLGVLNSNTTARDLLSSERGIGFIIRDNVIFCQVANATTLTTTTSGLSVSGLSDYDLTIYSNGAGSWQFYVNGSLMASGTGAPTEDSASGSSAMNLSLDNGTQTNASAVRIQSIKTIQLP